MTHRDRAWMIAWVWLAFVTGLAGCQSPDSSAQTPERSKRARETRGQVRRGQGTSGASGAFFGHPEHMRWRRRQGVLLSASTSLLERKQAVSWMQQQLQQAPWLAATSALQALVPSWVALLQRRSTSQEMELLRARVALLVWAVAPVLPLWWANDKKMATRLSQLLTARASLSSGRVAVLLLSACWHMQKAQPVHKHILGQEQALPGGVWRSGLAPMVVTIDARVLQRQRLHMARTCGLRPSWIGHVRMAKRDPRQDVREVAALILSRWQRQHEPFDRLLLSLSAASSSARHQAIAHLRHKRRDAWGQISRILTKQGRRGGKGRDLSLSAAYAASVMSMYPHHQVLAPWGELARCLRKASDPGVQRYLIQALRHWPQKAGGVIGQKDRGAHYQHLARLAWRERDTGVRDAALEALGSQRHTLHLWRQALAKRLRSRDWRQRRAALQGIALMVKRWRKQLRSRHKARTKGSKPTRRRLPRALAARQLLPLLRRGLKDPMARVQSAAAIASAALKSGARPLFPALQKLLKHRSGRLRYAGAEAFHLLGRHARPVVAALIAGLGDGNWGVRYSSSHALAAVGRAALPLLQQSLKSSQVRERLATVDTLLRMKSKRPSRLYLSLLRLALRDRAASVRFAAIRGLRRFAKAAGTPSLLVGSRDRDWRVREVAFLAMAALPWSRRFRRAAAAGLRDTSGAVREAAVSVLGRCRLAQCQTLLLTALADRHSLIQTKVAATLAGQTLSAGAIKALLSALSAPQPTAQPTVRSTAPTTARSTAPTTVQATAAIALATGGKAARKQLQDLSMRAPLARFLGDLALVLWGKEAVPDAIWARLVRQLREGTIAHQVRWRQICVSVLRRWLWLRQGLSPQVRRQAAWHQKLLRLLQASQWSSSVALRRASTALQVALLRLSDDGAMALTAPHPWVRQMMWRWWLSARRWKRLRSQLQGASGPIPRAILSAGRWRFALQQSAAKARH